jgi:dTDP-4-amino-4,6-dideoxygalactose transaminase
MTPVRPKERFLVFGALAIGDAEIREVVASLGSGWLGAGQAVAVHSCTAALHLGMLAAGLSPGDEVITTALTFCATVNPRTMNLDPADVERRITPRTRAPLPVHFAGRPCDTDALLGIARRPESRRP